MRISLFKNVYGPVYLAISGGVDSVVLLHRLILYKIKVALLFIHHGTEFCDQELKFVSELANRYSLQLIIRRIQPFNNVGSKEAYWSRERYEIFQSMDHLVLTGHHLDDAVEWYVMSTFQGTTKILDYQSTNVIRPLICTPKSHIKKYAEKNKLDYLTDPTNNNPNNGLRNKVRAVLMDDVHECFPGIRKTVAKLIRKKYETKTLT